MAEGERLDAGLVMTPRYRPPNSPPFVPPAGLCCAAVHDDFGVGFHRCSKRPKVKRDVLWNGREVTLEYCGIHDPVHVEAKRIARQAKYRAQADERDRVTSEAMRLRQLREAAVDAIKAIAKGHNDPRSLAIHVLTSCKEPIE